MYRYVTLTFPRWNQLNGTQQKTATKVSQVRNSSIQSQVGNQFAKFGMVACCLIMVAPIAAVLLTGGVDAVLGNIGLFLPLAACLGMHVVMHRMMGRSCHGEGSPETEADPQQDTVTIARPGTVAQTR
ncbi:DUF2933 domain-containing protein [Nioella ostreopsis]|uniref:DUF2933 domain-containing protein n=1 Tax=Nioella ostreopsis TaxID=2448479 RepID=UPI001F0B85C3|nr:DUF2933 domain-containing protein [Nioella ostreopsis]